VTHFTTVKRIVAIILLSCLFLTILGYHIVFRIHLSEIRAEMKQRLRYSSSKDALVLVLDKEESSQVEWENKHEFRYQNEMYDVIDQRREGSHLVIRCIPDEKEKELLEAYEKIAQKNNNSPAQTSLIKLITAPFIVSVSESLNQPQKEIQKDYFFFTAQLPANGGRAFKHPPKVC
jgi:hypothetical protein